MKYSEIKNLVYLVSDSGEIYNANKDFVTLMLGRKPEMSRCSFIIRLLLNYLARRNLT